MVELEQKMLLITNNSTRKIRSGIRSRAIKKEAKKHGIAVEVVKTDSLEAAKNAVARAVDEKIGIVGVLGGDGSVRTVIENLVHNPHTDSSDLPALAVFGGGSVNLLRKEIGMPYGVKKAIRAIAQGKMTLHDVCPGTISIDGGPEKVFVSNASMGPSAEMFKSRFLGIGGLIGYTPGALRAMWHAKHVSADVAIDGTAVDVNRSTDLIIQRAGRLGYFNFGKGFYDSKLFNFIRVKGSSDNQRVTGIKTLVTAVGNTLFRGGRPSSSEERRKGEKIEITNISHPIAVQIDGDYLGEAKESVVFDSSTKTVKMFVPEQRRGRGKGSFHGEGEKVVWKKPIPSVVR